MTDFPLFAQAELCPFCGEEALLDVLEVYPETREFEIETCCEGSFQWWVEDMREWTPEEWQRFFAEKAGMEVRSVGGGLGIRGQIHPGDMFLMDMGIELVKSDALLSRLAGASQPGALTLAETREYVLQQHRHGGSPPPAWAWGYAVYNGPPSNPVYEGGVPRVSIPKKGQAGGFKPAGLKAWPPTLIGVAMVGTPTARLTQARELAQELLAQGLSPELVQARLPRGKDKQAVSIKSIVKWGQLPRERVLDVTRMALDHNLPSFLTYKAASAVYVQAWQDACALGYDAVQTYTRKDEHGKSLQYARFRPVRETKGGQADRPSRRRAIRTAEQAQPKVLWKRRCPKATT